MAKQPKKSGPPVNLTEEEKTVRGARARAHTHRHTHTHTRTRTRTRTRTHTLRAAGWAGRGGAVWLALQRAYVCARCC